MRAPAVALLGGFRVGPGARGPARLPSPRQQELIAFLVLHAADAPVPRQRVAGSLWPDSAEAQALTNLRRELHHLREIAPELESAVEAGTRTLRWRADACENVDVIGFEAAAGRALDGDDDALEEAARRYTGDLLPDCASEWIEPARARLRQRAAAVLSRLVAILEQQRDYDGAIARAQHLLRIEPLDEPAWCALMRCHARRGDRATALHVYQECAALLKKELGVAPGAATRLTYREILDLDAAAPITPAPPRPAMYPLIGRGTEWRTLLRTWADADTGRARLCVIRGEAGIGKTRLAEELANWCGGHGIRALASRCYAGEGRLAYAPVAGWLKAETLQPVLAGLDDLAVADVARLHAGIAAARREAAAGEAQLESWQRVRFFDSLARAFHAAAPVALILDDLQWADADTLEWLHYFLRSSRDARCLVVGTARVGEEMDNPALVRVLAQLAQDDLLVTIALGPLDDASTGQLASAVAEHPLDPEDVARTVRETEGHPLFIIERGRMEAAGAARAPGATPPRVQSVVEARLALLSDDARAAADIAAAVGRDFAFDVLARASDLEEDALVRALDELWRRHLVRVQDDERWDFTHDRIREIAYAAIGPARRRLIHRRIAQAMELLSADRLDEASAAIAMHLERGGQASRAVPFLERAAAVAMRLSASEEAIRCLTRALALLETLAGGRHRDEIELRLRSALSMPLNLARGYAAVEVEQNLDRVFQLSRDDWGQVPVRWLWVAFTLRFMLGDLARTRELCDRALARATDDPSCACEAHHAMAGVLLGLGELEASRTHFEAALEAYDERHPRQSALGSDLGVFAHAWYTHTLWLLGDDAAALDHSNAAIALARRLHHPYSEALALSYGALLHQMRGDLQGVRDRASAAMALCDRYGFGYYGDWAGVLLGWADAQDAPDAGARAIESALERLDAQRAHARRPYYLSLLADAHARGGRVRHAAAIVDAAIELARKRSDRWWLPALYEQKSRLDPSSDRQGLLRQAADLARSQHSVALERRILAGADGVRQATAPG